GAAEPRGRLPLSPPRPRGSSPRARAGRRLSGRSASDRRRPMSLRTTLPAALRPGFHVALADVRERTRRYSFLAAMGVAAYFGYLVDAGYVTLSIENQRGTMGSAWVGTMTAMTLAVMLPLFGFYLVKSAIATDRATGVGELLAASPLGRLAYVAGKAASNLA